MTITAITAAAPSGVNPAAAGCRHPASRHGTPRQCPDCPAARMRQARARAPSPAQAQEAPVTIPYGTRPLDEARAFAAQVLWVPAGHMLDALTLAIAASHLLDAWNAAPRLLATSPAAQAGKTTLLNVIRLLAPSPWPATSATSWALRSKFGDRERPFVLVDEVSDIFGPSGRAGQHNPVATVARDCYLRNATVSISVSRTAEDIPAFCFMAMAGRRNAVPEDIYSRCIEFRMRPLPEAVTLQLDALDPDTEAMAGDVRTLLHAYMRAVLAPEIRVIQRRFLPPHPRFRDRLRQIWTPLYVTALAADTVERQRYEAECERCARCGEPPPEPPPCSWAQRALTAFKAMALDASDLPVLTSAQKALRDVAGYIRSLGTGPRYAYAPDARDWLRDQSGEELWSRLTDKQLARTMIAGLGPVTVRARPDDPARKAKCWRADDVLAAWDALERALAPAPPAAADEESIFDDEIAAGGGATDEDDPLPAGSPLPAGTPRATGNGSHSAGAP
jgi:hypothetical protein